MMASCSSYLMECLSGPGCGRFRCLCSSGARSEGFLRHGRALKQGLCSNCEAWLDGRGGRFPFPFPWGCIERETGNGGVGYLPTQFPFWPSFKCAEKPWLLAIIVPENGFTISE